METDSDIAGVKRLMSAILDDAILCYREGRDLIAVAPSSRRARLAKTAALWLFNDDEWLFSFVTICQVLELDIQGVRASLPPLPRAFGRPQ